MSALWADPSGRTAEVSTGDHAADVDADSGRPSVIAGGAGQGRLGRVPFVLVLIGLFGLGMAGLLALNTTLQGQAFEARSLHQQANKLTYQQAALERQVDDLRSVDKLAARAFGMGMRPNPQPAFVKLPDGKVISKPKPVTGNEDTGLIKTPEQFAAEREAAEAKKKAAEAKKQAAQARREAEAKKQAGQKQAGQKQAGQEAASGETDTNKQQESNERG